MDRIPFDQLDQFSYDDLLDILGELEITEEMAFNSDIGGDSDAEDDVLYGPTSSTTSSISSSTRGRLGSPSTIVASPTAPRPLTPPTIPPSQPTHDVSDSSSSDEDEPNAPTWRKSVRNVKKAYHKSKFDKPFGPRVNVNLSSPLEIFMIFFSEQLMLQIVDQSNLYAGQKGAKLDLSIEELKAFLGILIIMGFHNLPSIRLYWSEKINFRVSRIASICTVKRFLKILRYLHIADNTLMPPRTSPSFDKLHKIRPMITSLSQNFQNSFWPSRTLSVDESMVAYKGRSSMKQYMPLKPIKRGFKVWVICCAKTGYMIGFEIYTGKSDRSTTVGLGESVVLKLSSLLESTGYCIFFDRFFSSVSLVLKLLKKGLFSCGTIQANRKFLPVMKKDHEIEFGTFDYRCDENISVTKWMDRGKKAVQVISSMANPKKNTPVTRRNKTGLKEVVNCPEPISQYNKYMGGVDMFDQRLSFYSVSWKSKRWWMKLFYYLLDCSIVNAYIVYKNTADRATLSKYKSMTQLLFRDQLANELIQNFCSRARGSAPQSSPGLSIPRTKAKFTGKKVLSGGCHDPVKSTKPGRCGHCSTRKAPKRSRMRCATCDVALCINCFGPFHKKS